MSSRAIQVTEVRLGITKDGIPVSGGYVKFLQAGTTSLATVWQDKDKALEADNPIQLDTQGRALVYADGELKLETYDDDPATTGVLLWTWDFQKYQAASTNVVTKLANYTATAEDDLINVDTAGGAITITLGDSIGYSHPLYIKKVDASANAVTVLPQAGESIDGNTSMSLVDQNQTLHIFPDGSNWWTVQLTSVAVAEDSDTVDGIHAAATPQPNKLLALNASSQFPPEVGGAPVGSGMDFWGTSLPAGYLWAAGQAVSRTTYANLFAAIGTTFGAGDGSTTFNLPDKRDRVSAGRDNMGGLGHANRLTFAVSGGINGDVLGGSGGNQLHTLTINEMPSHQHGIPYGFSASGTSAYMPYSRSSTVATDPAGGNAPHNNVQPTIMCNYIIKY